MYESNQDFFFKIIDLQSDMHIGNVRIGPINKAKVTSFGILIGEKNSHNRGSDQKYLSLF